MIFICGLATIPATVHAQQKTPASERTLTAAELRARVNALEQELAGIQRDFQLLLTTASTCSSASPTQPTAEERDRATLAAKEQAIYEANERAYDEQLRQLENASWYVRDVDFGVTEQNRVFARFGWKATIHNGTPRAQTDDVEVQFLDDRDLIVATDRLYRRVIEAQGEQVLRGNVLIRFPSALKVTKITVVAKRHPEAR